jgi:hypothetical protein
MKFLAPVILSALLYSSFALAQSPATPTTPGTIPAITIVPATGTGLAASPSMMASQTGQFHDLTMRQDFSKIFSAGPKNNSPAVAARPGSTGTSGGGDLFSIDAHSLIEFMTSRQFNQVVKKYAQEISVSVEQDQDLQRLWTFMMQNGLLDDIDQSKYVPQDHCGFGSDPNAIASTEIPGDEEAKPSGGDICFDIPQIIANRASWAALIATALHEHIHHFGFGEYEAYKITGMVGSQLLGMSISNSAPAANQLAPDDHELLGTLKIGTKMKMLQDVTWIEKPVIQNGAVISGLAGVTPGVYCRVEGSIRPGETVKVMIPTEGFLTTERSGTSTASMIFLTGQYDDYADLICERLPDEGPQITVRDFINTVDGVFQVNVKTGGKEMPGTISKLSLLMK